jgi:hypothetical protein
MQADISERALGQFPISVATSLALEAGFGIHPEIKTNKQPILEYKQLWINLRTVYRNIMGALAKNNKVMSKEVAECLMDEMQMIDSIIAERTNGNMTVVYYVSNYQDMERHYKKAVVRADTTEKQKEYTMIQTKVLEAVLKAHQGNPNVRVFKRKLEGDNLPKSLIITHIAYDLLSSKLFHELDLLESHTGKIKHKSQWYTKYYNGNELSIIPFREDMLQIFGDKETFRPMNHDLRKEILDLAVKYHWTSITTSAKIRFNVEEIKNPYAKEIIKSILIS